MERRSDQRLTDEEIARIRELVAPSTCKALLDVSVAARGTRILIALLAALAGLFIAAEQGFDWLRAHWKP